VTRIRTKTVTRIRTKTRTEVGKTRNKSTPSSEGFLLTPTCFCTKLLIMNIADYIVKNWDCLPKSKFDDVTVVIFKEIKNEDWGYGHHTYEGYGVDKNGKCHLVLFFRLQLWRWTFY
jgi:phenylpyruvate tautomerase PptA (4-oxalocrotonate tautomerase family)